MPKRKNETYKEYYLRNWKRQLLYAEKFRLNNKDKKKKYQDSYNEAYYQKNKKRISKKKKIEIEKLSDSYIINQLTKQSINPTNEMIELKRQHIKLKRTINNLLK